MHRRELERRIAERLGWQQERVRRALDVTAHTISHHLAADVAVTVPSLGSFVTHDREEQAWYSPLLRRLLMLPTKKLIRFHVGRALRRRLHEAP